MHFVYVLQSQKDKLLYIGFTNDVKSRVLRHNQGEVPATKFRRPLSLIYFEGHTIKTDALRRERYFKTTKGKVSLRLMLKDFFANSS